MFERSVLRVHICKAFRYYDSSHLHISLLTIGCGYGLFGFVSFFLDIEVFVVLVNAASSIKSVRDIWLVGRKVLLVCLATQEEGVWIE